MPLFIPSSRHNITESMVYRWNENLFIELEEGGYTKRVIEILSDQKNYYGQFLDNKTCTYYRHHFIRSIAECLSFLFSRNETPRLLDIGCGCGMQSILMALLGADVVGVDISTDAISVCEKRKSFYEKRLGRKIPVTFVEGNIMQQRKETIGLFNGIYSLFAWELIEPQNDLVEWATDLLEANGMIVLQNTNPLMWFRRLFQSKTGITADEIIRLMSECNIKCVKTSGTVALPKELWMLPFLHRFLKYFDQIFARSKYLSISYLYMGYATRQRSNVVE